MAYINIFAYNKTFTRNLTNKLFPPSRLKYSEKISTGVTHRLKARTPTER